MDHLHALPDQELEQLPLGMEDLHSLGDLVRQKKGKPVGCSRLVKMDEQGEKKDEEADEIFESIQDLVKNFTLEEQEEEGTSPNSYQMDRHP